ncbi:hypothetical protein D3C81_1404490 [compost metagenome]
MLKNGMRSNSFKQESSSKKVAAYDIQAIIKYCIARGINSDDLTEEELKRFEIKRG